MHYHNILKYLNNYFDCGFLSTNKPLHSLYVTTFKYGNLYPQLHCGYKQTSISYCFGIFLKKQKNNISNRYPNFWVQNFTRVSLQEILIE